MRRSLGINCRLSPQTRYFLRQAIFWNVFLENDVHLRR
uniref:Uncharacterized protein n=1 Tax=Lepeophtheirus salmonis TaxID=72036 RepID=A0A0K2USP9_LEPSM